MAAGGTREPPWKALYNRAVGAWLLHLPGHSCKCSFHLCERRPTDPQVTPDSGHSVAPLSIRLRPVLVSRCAWQFV